MQVFAFLDVEHPAVAWAVARGVLVSADHAPDATEAYASFMVAGLIQHQCNWRLSNETIIEHFRGRYYSNRVSRLRGMYFFSSQAQAQRAIEEKWGAHFRTENLVELTLASSGEVTRVDANWISSAPLRDDGRLDTSNISWIEKYWSGEPYNDEPSWELIAVGEARVVTSASKERAIEVVKREFPRSWEFMEMSRLAADVGSHGGLTTPFIRRVSDSRFRLDYIFFDGDFKNKDVIDKMTRHPDWKHLLDYARAHIQEDLILPDFRPWCQEFSLGLQDAENLNVMIASVHHPA
jgi:hypothetical protein